MANVRIFVEADKRTETFRVLDREIKIPYRKVPKVVHDLEAVIEKYEPSEVPK